LCKWQQASTLSGKRKEVVKMMNRNNHIDTLVSIPKQLKTLKFTKILSKIQQIQGDK
jgi:REP element-mobilizing transposase RayT